MWFSRSYAFQTTIPGSQRRVDGRTTVAFRFVSARGPPRRRLLRARAATSPQKTPPFLPPPPAPLRRLRHISWRPTGWHLREAERKGRSVGGRSESLVCSVCSCFRSRQCTRVRPCVCVCVRGLVRTDHGTHFFSRRTPPSVGGVGVSGSRRDLYRSGRLAAVR